MINAIIIDDEPGCIAALSNDLDMFCPTVKVVTTCSSGRQGIEAIQTFKPHLIFLDVEMPVINGFEMLQQLDTKDLQVIFTTAYDQFAARAFRISAIDYLLKPIDSAELIDAVARAEKLKDAQKDNNNRLANFLKNDLINDDTQKIALASRDGYEFVLPSEVIYFKAEGAYTNIFLTNGQTMLISKALGETELLFPSSKFERVHHSIVINITYIKQFKKSEGLFVVMSNGHILNVARSKKDSLLLRLGIK